MFIIFYTFLLFEPNFFKVKYLLGYLEHNKECPMYDFFGNDSKKKSKKASIALYGNHHVV
jgi:hypothetical protein